MITSKNMKMKIKNRIILRAAGLAALCGVVAACTNDEEGFHVADGSDLRLILRPANTQTGQAGGSANLSTINAVNGYDTVYVECQAKWKVEVNDNRPEGQSDWTLYITEQVNNGKTGYFVYRSSVNISGGQRDWTDAIKVSVEGLDGDIIKQESLQVIQNANVVLLNPNYFEIFPAAGGSRTIEVTSSDNSWSVMSNAENAGWLTIDRSKKDTGESQISFTVQPNSTSSLRSTTLEFLDASQKVVATIDISQSASTNTFAVSSDNGDIMPCEGGEFTINVLSDGKWKLQCAEASDNGWLAVEGFENGGVGYSQPANDDKEGGAGTRLKVTVKANPNELNREATLIFSRVNDGATLLQGGVEPKFIKITQAGTLQPALSEIWLGDNYDQRHVEIFGRYFFNGSVEESGFEICNITKNSGYVDVKNLTGVEGEQNEKGYIHVRLQNGTPIDALEYRAGNQYSIRPYLIIDGEKKTGQTFYNFTAPGKKPENDDQSKPEVQ